MTHGNPNRYQQDESDATRGRDLLQNHPEVSSAIIGVDPEAATAMAMSFAEGRKSVTERPPVSLDRHPAGEYLRFNATDETVQAVQPKPEMPPVVPGVIGEGTDVSSLPTAPLPPINGPRQ